MPFEYDVFISYARDDNDVPVGGKAAFGFVTGLKENINRGPGVTKKSICIACVDGVIAIPVEYDGGNRARSRIDSFSVSSLLFAKMISGRRLSRHWGSGARAGTAKWP